MSKKSKPTKKDQALEEYISYLKDNGKIKKNKSFEERLQDIINDSFDLTWKKMEFSDYSLADILALDETGFIEYTKCQPDYITSLPGDLRSNDPNVLTERLDEIDKRKNEVDEHISELQAELEESDSHAEYWEKQADFQKTKLEESPLATEEYWDDVYGELEYVFANAQWQLTDEYTSGEYMDKYPTKSGMESRILSEKYATENYIKENNIDRQAVIDAWTRAGYGDFINSLYTEVDNLYTASHNLPNTVDSILAHEGYHSASTIEKAKGEAYQIGNRAIGLSKLLNNRTWVEDKHPSKRDYQNDQFKLGPNNNIYVNDKFVKEGYTFTKASLNPLIDGYGRPFGSLSHISRDTGEVGNSVFNYALYEGTALKNRGESASIQREIEKYQKQSDDLGREHTRTSNKLNQ